MRWRLGLSLSLLLACVLLGFLGYRRAADTESVGPVLPADLSMEQVEHIQLSRPDGTDIRLRRGTGGWWLDAPLDLPANPQRVQTLLSILSTPTHAEFPAAESELNRFALLAPRLSLRINSLDFYFGTTESLYSRRYVRFRDSVYLLDDYLYPVLNLPAQFFASRRPLPTGAQVLRVRYAAVSRPAVWYETTQLDSLVAWAEAEADATAPRKSIPAQMLLQVHVTGDGEPLRFESRSEPQAVVLVRPERQIEYHFSGASGLAQLGLLPSDGD